MKQKLLENKTREENPSLERRKKEKKIIEEDDG